MILQQTRPYRNQWRFPFPILVSAMMAGVTRGFVQGRGDPGDSGGIHVNPTRGVEKGGIHLIL